ncbi:MAG TPA: vWA domain-containing protein [Gaiellaceae bacterium]|nr:vWA domain-containing protein [Gaiellaceae bacterium]
MDAAALAGAARRTLLLRLAAAGAALALLAGAFASARGLEEGRGELLPRGTSGVVVLDVSLSIIGRDYPRVRSVLARLAAADSPVGLVVFSDVAYELLPPGTPARELRPLLRFFTSVDGRLPRNPWARSFRAGTRISEALRLAERMLRRDRVERGSILLLSDLDTAPQDLAALGRTLERLRRSPIAVRVVPLSPTRDGVLLFESLLGREAFAKALAPASAAGPPPEEPLRAPLPLGFLALAVLVLLALAAHELLSARLALPAPDRLARGDGA